MLRIVTGLFSDRRDADLAADHLEQEFGVPRERVRLHTHPTLGAEAQAPQDKPEAGPQGARLPPDVLAAHAEGLGRGGVLLAAWVEQEELQRALQTFREYGAASPTAHAMEDPGPEAARQDAVRMRAYYLWESAGRPEGRDLEFWDRANREDEAGEGEGSPAARAPQQFAGETGAAPWPERGRDSGG